MKSTYVTMAIITTCLYSMTATAFTLAPRAKACMLYFKSDAVFSGKVISEHTDQHKSGGENWIKGWSYTLKVIKGYKGVRGPIISVYTYNDSARLPLDTGKKYLLFAQKYKGKLIIAYDQVSGRLANSQKTVKSLDVIAKRKPGEGGEVYGRVVENPWNDTEGGLQGVRVTVEGSAGTANATSNKMGWFHVHVPAGTYSAEAKAQHLTFENQDIAWQNAKHFVVPNGGCAEIQLQAQPTSRKLP